MNELTTIQYAWIIYFAGSLGCTIAAWWMFLWAWRFVRYSAVVTAMTILFTPYAIDVQTMTMAPAVYTLVFEGMSQGLPAIIPVIKVMVGIWLIGIILVSVFVILTRKWGDKKASPKTVSTRQSSSRKSSSRQSRAEQTRPDDLRPSSQGLSRAEYQAREELLRGEVPMRAVRD
jgi:hypothetical protein